MQISTKRKKKKDPIPLGMVDISVLNTDSSFYVISYGNIEEGSSITMQIDTLVDSVYVLADIKPGIVLTKDSFDIHTVLPSKPMKNKSYCCVVERIRSAENYNKRI